MLAMLALPAVAQAGSFDERMDALAEVDQRRARFVEERRLGMLNEPLVIEGTLAYTAPDRLVRQDLLPHPALYQLDGDQLRIAIGSEERVVSLDREPQLRAMIAPFLAIFAGDRSALNREFDVRYAEGADAGWQLDLTPRSEAASSHFLARLNIRGKDTVVKRIELHEHDGDQVIMTITELQN